MLLKILFLVTNLGSGGAERTVAYLTGFLAQKGWDVTLMSMQDTLFYQLDPAVRSVTLGIPHVPLSLKTAPRWLYHHLRRRFFVPRAVQKAKPDVVFCMLSNAATHLPKNRGYCLISSERSSPAMLPVAETKERSRIFSSCDMVMFQTERALEFYPLNIQAHGKVIPNALGNPHIAHAVRPKERTKKISAIGRLSAEKDFPTLLRAFALVYRQYNDYRLEIFGSGADREKLELLAQELGIADVVDFRGADPEAIVRIADAACYVLCSKYEGMPNALMEAMAVGLPCVATDCPNGPAELIVHGENGLLVPVGNVQKLAEAITEMLRDRDFAERCGDNAMKIRSTHSMDVVAQEYMNYIEEALKRYQEKKQRSV